MERPATTYRCFDCRHAGDRRRPAAPLEQKLDAMVVVVDPRDSAGAEMARRIRDLDKPVTAAIVVKSEELS